MKNSFIALVFVFFLMNCKSEKQNSDASKTQDSSKIGQFELNKNIQLADGKLYRYENFPTDLIQPRTIDVWLPNDYSSDKKYAVLYMHDGQMLFDAKTTWNHQEWKVDEWSSQLMNENKTKDFIVIAIHNISEIRWQDYFPQKTLNYLDSDIKQNILNELGKNQIQLNSNNYLKFLVEELKPEIDKTFSTLPNQENTFIAGSSMGGLISMYAICEYPKTFSGAGCLSTHWIGMTSENPKPEIPKAIFSYLKEHIPSPKNHKFYFDYGTETLDAKYVQFADDVDAIFEEKGYDETNFANLKFDGTDHSENAWNQRLDKPFTFLLNKTE